MEEKKNNNLITIILVVLLVIAVGVICYLLGSNSVKEVNNKENTTEEKENNLDTTTEQENTITPVSYSPKCNSNNTNYLVDVDETKYNNLVDYIKDQQNVKITLSYCIGSEIEQTNYTLNETEKNSALNEIGNHNMENIGGVGGGGCVPTTKISYTRNNTQYFINYWGTIILNSNDGNVYKIIDKTSLVTPIQGECQYLTQSLGTTINNITKYER